MTKVSKDELIKLFLDPSDGSLPEISLYFQSKDDRTSAIVYMLARSKVSERSSIYLDNQDVPCSSLSFEQLVTKLDTSHHVLLTNFLSCPDLGLGIFENGLSLDFRTGSDWNENSAARFLDELQAIKKLTNSTKVALDEDCIYFNDHDRQMFQAYFD